MKELETAILNCIKNQRSYFNSGATLPIDFRITQLKKIKFLIAKHENELHQAIFNDFKKSKYENQLTEIFPIYHEIDNAIKNLKQWVKPQKVSTNLLNHPAKSYLIPEPLGLSLIISAWNFPFNLSFIPLVSSIAAGNTCILKPSELPKETSKIIAKIINANFDAHYIKVIEGGVSETTALINQRFDKIFFTGSPRVGKIINQAAAKHLTNITLELGGKNPVIFSDKASLKTGVKRLVWAKFLNAGQICVTADYVLVHQNVKNQFLKLAIREIQKSNFSIENHNFLQIIDDRNFDRLTALINNNKVAFGGVTDKENRYISPTIIDNIHLKDPIMQEEIFGPILPMITYKNLNEAFQIIKQYEKPLSAYLFSNDKKEKQRFLKEIPFGNGAINDVVMQLNNPKLPFGGVGNSGLGNYHGKYGFDCFSHTKGILDKSNLIELNLKYYGYNSLKVKIIKFLNRF